MDDETKDAVLAHMAYRIVGNRRRDLAESIALRLFRENGTVSADEVTAVLDAEWVEPDAQEILDLVARKAKAAIDYHEAEAIGRTSEIDAADVKVAKLSTQLEAAKDAVRELAARPDSTDARDAAELLAHVVSQGGKAENAPVGAGVPVSAEVAEAAAAAMGPKG